MLGKRAGGALGNGRYEASNIPVPVALTGTADAILDSYREFSAPTYVASLSRAARDARLQVTYDDRLQRAGRVIIMARL
jgi:hypothetical protein